MSVGRRSDPAHRVSISPDAWWDVAKLVVGVGALTGLLMWVTL